LDLPLKKTGLETHTLADQVVVYDSNTNRVHYLNPTAAFVLEFCDGKHGAEDIAVEMREAYTLSADPLDEVRDCLVKLREQELIGQ
jgi:hypothetical protein